MISSQILIDFINLQKTIEAKDVKCNSKVLSFVAPACLKNIIIDTFEPISDRISFSELNYKESLYVIQ